MALCIFFILIVQPFNIDNIQAFSIVLTEPTEHVLHRIYCTHKFPSMGRNLSYMADMYCCNNSIVFILQHWQISSFQYCRNVTSYQLRAYSVFPKWIIYLAYSMLDVVDLPLAVNSNHIQSSTRTIRSRTLRPRTFRPGTIQPRTLYPDVFTSPYVSTLKEPGC